MKFGLYVITIFLILFSGITKGSEKNKTTFSPTQDEISINNYSWININNISTVFGWSGFGARNPVTGNAGCVFPRGKTGVVFQEGLIWGGLANDGILPRKRVGGNLYSTGTIPGWVENGVPADWENDPSIRIYRIRKDYRDISDDKLRRDAAETFFKDLSAVTKEDINDLRQQYQRDWEEWPVEHGAPYYDLNDNGFYEPELGETPGLLEADQVLWFAINDFDSQRSLSIAFSPPLGLEIQITIWAYSRKDIFNDLYFKRYKVINRSGSDIDSLYLGQWVDPDVGNYYNDYVGCDSLYSVGFCYNGNPEDRDFGEYGLAPGAVAYQILSGPIIPSPGDTALFNYNPLPDFKNITMTSFGYSRHGASVGLQLPSYENTLEWYNALRGYKPTATQEPDIPFLNMITGSATKFPLSGDPVSRRGDIDGILYSPGDCRMLLSTGPANLAAGAEQEIIIAAIGGLSEDYLASVGDLRNKYMASSAFFNDMVNKKESLPVLSVNAWNDDLTARLMWTDLSATELNNGYRFIGYNLFQVDFETGERVKLWNYDVVDGLTVIWDNNSIVYEGEENGLAFNAEFFRDIIKSRPFFYGDRVKYQVAAYFYNADAGPGKKVISNSDKLPTAAITFLPLGYTDTLETSHTKGAGSGEVFATVIDPAKIKNDKYLLNIDWNENSTDIVGSFYNLSKDSLIASNLTVAGRDNIFVFPDEGIRLVINSNSMFYGWDYEGNRWVSGVNWGGAQFFGGADIPNNTFWGTILKWPELESAQMIFQDRADVENDGYISKGAVYRRDLSYAWTGTGQLPFAAYGMRYPENPRRLNICFVEDSNIAPANSIWDMGWNGNTFPDDEGAREYFFIMASDYDEGIIYNDENFGPDADVIFMVWPKNRGSRKYLSDKFTMDFFYGRGFGLDSLDQFLINASLFDGENDGDRILNDFILHPNFPNPFNKQTTISFTLLRDEEVKMEVFNILGQKITTLINENLSAGPHIIAWNASTQSTGMYFIRLQTKNRTKVIKILLAK